MLYDDFLIPNELLTFSEHASERMLERDVDDDEVYEVFRRSEHGFKGKRKNTLEVRATTSHNRTITVVYTRRPNGPHIITVTVHSGKKKGR